MPLLLFIAFIVVPIVELAVIVQVAQVIDLAPTIVLLVVISIAGAWLVRREGASAWRRFQAALQHGRAPTNEVVDGALVLFGGALLLTPGFVTDLLGLSLVFPPTRALVNRLVRGRVRSSFGVPGLLVGLLAARRGAPRRRTAERDVVDVEVVDVEREQRRH